MESGNWYIFDNIVNDDCRIFLSDTDNAENLTSIIFVIEIVLIQNIEANYNDTLDELNEFDWTISCVYDPKVTDS